MRNTEIQTWISSLELTEAITGRYSITPDTSTYQRGRSLIDGIFMSRSITIKNCGYLPSGYFPLDHRGLWVDIDFEKVFGYITSSYVRPSARRLKTDDPGTVHKWQQAYKSFLQDNNLLHCQWLLEALITSFPLTEDQIKTYNSIVCQHTKGMKIAERNVVNSKWETFHSVHLWTLRGKK